MALALRTLLLASAAAISGCVAANPRAPDRAPIDYRGAAPASRPVAAAPGPRVTTAPVPPPRVVDVGPSANGLSGIEEAKLLAPQAGARPGGALTQIKDSKAKRAIAVQRGDTLYDISRRYSVNMRALIETNGLEPPYALDPGRTIYLPPPNTHIVERGETLYSVSRRYNVDTRSLALLNTMSRPWTIYPGDELLLPPLARDQSRRTTPVSIPVAATPPPVVLAPSSPSIKPPAPKSTPAPASKTVSTPAKEKPVSPPKTTPAPKPAIEAAAGPRDFIWPVSGELLKDYGVGEDGLRNDGVNIGVPKGTKVKAAADGEVVYAGSELVGFGNLILIRHAGGWVSAYAHAETVLVKEGAMVRQGQAIAEAGATGNASIPQVHFELRKGREPVDPNEHLPPFRG
ncbi:MAG TPA: M23 family metallopeptidase [Hyphomonadaceae bacterium]